MKTTILFNLLLIIVISYSTAQTNVGGLISTNTHWTLGGSPYIVMQNILIDSSFTLTIDPGVTIRFNASKLIQIRGGIIAKGTQFDKILFTSNSTNPNNGDWKYLLFESESIDYDTLNQTGSILKNCIIEYGGIPSNPYSTEFEGVVKLFSAHPLIDSCIIRNNLSAGIYGESLNNLQISNCIIKNNKDGGIIINSYNYIKILKNNIFKNGVTNNSHCSTLRLGWGTNFLIKENVICNNMGEAVDVAGSTVSSFEKNIVVNNITPTGTSCIEFVSSPSISRNIFANNTANLNVYLSSASNTNFFKNHLVRNKGVTLAYLGSNGNLINNTFADNYSDNIYFSNAINNISIGGFPTQFQRNNFFDNRINPCTPYEFANLNDQTTIDFNAKYNFWNKLQSSAIDSLIYDWFDDTSIGLVDYTPYLILPDTIAPISPPDNVIKTDLGNGNVQVSWNANIEADLMGYKIYYGLNSCCSFNNMVDVGDTTTYTLSGLNFSDTIAVTAYDHQADNIEDQIDGNESWFSFDQQYYITKINQLVSYSENNIFIYPNPATNIALVKFNKTLINGKLRVFNILGKEIKSINNINVHEIEIVVSDLSKGLFYIIIYENDKVLGSIKLITE